jgi:hypothetical protein
VLACFFVPELLPPELTSLDAALAAVERDAVALLDGLDEGVGGWRAAPGSWSVAECLDHLAVANRVYVAAMRPAAAGAADRPRRRPAKPGVVGGLFVWSLEPPVKRLFKLPAPPTIRPRAAPTLAESSAAFFASHRDAVAFLHEVAALDLAGIRFVNPFLPGVRFSLATGLHVIAAHERRHLWQAWRVRRAAEASSSFAPREAPGAML